MKHMHVVFCSIRDLLAVLRPKIAIPGAIEPKMGENLSEMWPNRRTKFHANR